jgi:hypothetical protein
LGFIVLIVALAITQIQIQELEKTLLELYTNGAYFDT